jgi:hypothetical protein
MQCLGHSILPVFLVDPFLTHARQVLYLPATSAAQDSVSYIRHNLVSGGTEDEPARLILLMQSSTVLFFLPPLLFIEGNEDVQPH